MAIFTLSPEMQATWNDLMGQMCAFVDDTNADVDMAYDWVCEMLDIDSFVAVSYTHLRAPRDQRGSRMPSSA